MDDEIPETDDVFDPDASSPKVPDKVQPLFQIYEGSRIAVGSGIGKHHRQLKEAAVKAYEAIYAAWNEAFRYYNNNQTKDLETERGTFKRGDNAENIVFSQINLLLPAVYSKNPDITCTTTDRGDEQFCETLGLLIGALMRRRDLLNAKPKIKRAAGLGLLTNHGVLKLDLTKKDDSRELAANEMARITKELEKAKTAEETAALYGELQALEENMEMLEPAGIGLRTLLPHNLIIDPAAEQTDGLDAGFMIERTWLPTNMLISRFTKADPESDDKEDKQNRVLLFKPTHKAVFSEGAQGSRDDGLGLVMEAFDAGELPTEDSDPERTAYLNMYFTECYYLWEKATRRVFLYHRDDWTWPLWVWDDELKITRFYPYFLINYSMSTGGATSVGDVAYYLDQQDEINEINKQLSRIRRSLFNNFYYNSDTVKPEEAEKFVKALVGAKTSEPQLLGVAAGEKEISKMIEAFLPPIANYKELFDTEPLRETVNRVTNTSDALRGVQFKTNTNVEAVNTYQESMRLAIGAKVDVIEDVVEDLAVAIAEISVQNFDVEYVSGLIGSEYAKAWQQMPLEQFKSTYSLELVAGSMEKPNSVFMKKEAVQISQAVGQFAQAAPGATLRVMLRVLEKAFSEVNIKKEDWDAIDREIEASTQKGVSTQQGQDAAASGQANPVMQKLQALPDTVKRQVVEMKENGSSREEIAAFLKQQLTQNQPQTAA